MTTRAGVYARISYARAGEIKTGAAAKGEVLGVDKQLPPCQALCDRLGWEVADTYVDPNDSAYSGRPRKHWNRLLADVAAGRIDAIVAWHPDRLTRQPKENEDLITLVDRHGVQLATAMAGEHDLATPSGRLHFRMLGSIARYESEHRAERVMVHHDGLAEQGRWHGGRRPFGYRYVPDGGIEVDEREAAAIREAARRILAGGSLSAVARKWRAGGLMVSKGGRPVTVTSIDRLLRSPHLIGDRVHRGQVTAHHAWPAILTADKQAAVVAMLDSRGQALVTRARTMLGGLVHCGATDCGHVMRGATLKAAGGRQPGYRCDSASGGCGRLHRLAGPVDDEVRGRVIATLASPKLRAKIAAAYATKLSAGQTAEVRAALDVDRVRLAQLDALAEDLGAEAVADTRSRIKARMASTSRRLAAGVRTSPLDGLPDTTAELERAWAGWSVDRRREVVELVVKLPPEGTGITLVPVGRGRRAGPEHVKVDWRV